LTIAPPVPAASAEEDRIEVCAKDTPPLRFRHIDGAIGVRNPGIVDQDGDGAELRLGGVEGALDRVAVEDVGLDGDNAAARRLDPGRNPGEPIPASRHQSDGSAIGRQKLGETRPEAARRAGH
jgi:hypothetical protein